MNRKLVLVGGGGHCKSVLDVAERMGAFGEIVITDPDIFAGTEIFGSRVVGNDDCLSELFEKGYEDAFITVGSIKSTSVRRKLYEKLKTIGFSFPNIIDSSAVVSEHAVLHQGIFVGKEAVINADAEIGDFAIINTGSIIEHECKIGKFTHIAVGATLCGQVTVGEDCLIGAGSTVIQDIKIGDNVIVGAGSLVRHDVRNNLTIFGGGGLKNRLRLLLHNPIFSASSEEIGGVA